MSENIRKGLLAIIVIVLAFAGCKKDDKKPSGSSGPKGKLSLMYGNGQSGTYGQDLQDSVVVKITPPLGGKAGNYSLLFKMVQGNGIIENASPANILSTPPADNGIVQIKWRLGCNTPNQKVTLYLYPDSAFYNGMGVPNVTADDSLTISASGVKPTGWGRACGCGAPIYSPKIASFDKQTLYMANNGLYSSTDGGVNWYVVSGVPNWATIQDVQFNSKGWMYVLTANNGVYYTQDKKTWQAINNGILDMRTPTTFLVTDDLLFVSFYFDGPYLTTNNGAFWQKLLVGFSSQRFYLAKQHPNGSLYLFNDWNNLLTSKDTGKTWQLIPLSGAMVNYAAYDLEIGPDGTIYIGSGDATIAYISPITNQGTYKSFYQYDSWSQSANNITFSNNNIYFLLNANPQPGIYSGSNNNYTLINLGFSKIISYYYMKQDGTFILGSDDGWYYHN